MIDIEKYNQDKKQGLEKQQEKNSKKEKKMKLINVAQSIILNKLYSSIENYELYYNKIISNDNSENILELQNKAQQCKNFIIKYARGINTFNVYKEILDITYKCILSKKENTLLRCNENSVEDFLKAVYLNYKKEFEEIENGFKNIKSKDNIIPYSIIAGYVFRKRASERNKPYFKTSPLSLYRQQFTQLYKNTH